MTRTHVGIGILVLAFGFGCGGSTSRTTNSPSSSVSPPISTPDRVRSLIPTSAVQVDVMDIRGSARLDALQAKISAATKSDPTALTDQVKKAAPGQPISYSPRLGLTKAEFEEFLREADNLHLEKVGQGTLRFAPESDSRFRLDGGGDTLNQLNGVVIDLKRNVVETPIGVCSDRSDFAASAGQHLTGPANGTEWALRQGDDTTPTLTKVEFTLGRIVATGKVFLSYDAKHAAGGKADVSVLVTVTYSL